METNKHEVLSESKSVEWYQKYVHIKVCQGNIYIPRAWTQVKMTFIPVPRKANFTEAKGYHPISLLTSTQKRCKNWWPGMSRMKHWSMSHTSIKSTYKPDKSTETPMHNMITHIQEAVVNREYTWTFLHIVGASDSTSQDITKAPNIIGLETHCSDGLAPCCVAEKLKLRSQELFWRGVWPSAIRRGAFH
jgi:hypothetical protein